MLQFQCTRSYVRKLDIREYGDMLSKVVEPPPAGVMWLFLARRRGRKTWTLQGIQDRLGPQGAAYSELRVSRAMPKSRGIQGFCHLLDEPAPLLEDHSKAQKLLKACRRIHEAGERVLLALTPRELQHLVELDLRKEYVSFYEARIQLPPFSEQEAMKQAERSEAAAALLGTLPPEWRSSPFLLELVLEVAEKEPLLEGVYLLRAALQRCRQLRYPSLVFQDSLDDVQRAALRSLAQGIAPVSRVMIETLTEAGYVRTTDERNDRAVVVDPFLAAHLTPLRIHHLSDMHFGKHTAPAIDVKEDGPIANAAGSEATLRDGYLTQLQRLRARDMAPHLILVSGDLAELAAEAEFEEARAFLEKARALLQPNPFIAGPTILLVGGNHDVEWGKVLDPDQARHRAFANAFPLDAFARPQLEVPAEARRVARVEFRDFGVELLLLGSSEVGGDLSELARLRRALDKIEQAEQVRELLDRALNEDAAIDYARADPGLVHHKDLERARAEDWRQPVRIAVVHHPVTAMPSVDIGRYTSLLNAGAVKEVLFKSKFALVLHGHAHAACFIEERWPGRYESWTLRVAAAASLGSSQVAEHNGYNEIEILRDIDIVEERGVEDIRETSRVVVRHFKRLGNSNWEASEAVLGPFVAGEPS